MSTRLETTTVTDSLFNMAVPRVDRSWVQWDQAEQAEKLMCERPYVTAMDTASEMIITMSTNQCRVIMTGSIFNGVTTDLSARPYLSPYWVLRALAHRNNTTGRMSMNTLHSGGYRQCLSYPPAALPSHPCICTPPPTTNPLPAKMDPFFPEYLGYASIDPPLWLRP